MVNRAEEATVFPTALMHKRLVLNRKSTGKTQLTKKNVFIVPKLIIEKMKTLRRKTNNNSIDFLGI